jgi:hypothetical protein
MVTIDELLVQYQTATRGMEPGVLRPFLEGLEEVSPSIEAAQITQEATVAPLRWRVTLVTSQGLAILHTRYDGPVGACTVEAALHDWRSVARVELTYKEGFGGLLEWRLNLGHPQLTVSDRDDAKTRAVAAAILRHMSPN